MLLSGLTIYTSSFGLSVKLSFFFKHRGGLKLISEDIIDDLGLED